MIRRYKPNCVVGRGLRASPFLSDLIGDLTGFGGLGFQI